MSEIQKDVVHKALIGENLPGMACSLLGKIISERLEDSGLLRTCLNCEHWNTDGSYGKSIAHDKSMPEGCKLFRALPPPKIIVHGCDKHTDAIPF